MKTEEVAKFFVALAKFGTVAGNVYEDGKIGFSDLSELGRLIGAAQDLATVNYAEAIDEFTNWSAEEKKAVYDRFVAEFDLPQDEVELKVEKFAKIALDTFEVVKKVIDAVSGFKKKD